MVKHPIWAPASGLSNESGLRPPYNAREEESDSDGPYWKSLLLTAIHFNGLIRLPDPIRNGHEAKALVGWRKRIDACILTVHAPTSLNQCNIRGFD